MVERKWHIVYTSDDCHTQYSHCYGSGHMGLFIDWIYAMKKRMRKNCPACRYWWFNRQTHGCTKNPERLTYTSLTLEPKTKDRDWCSDMKRRKNA